MATPAIPANCQAVTNTLLTESGRLVDPIYRRAIAQRPIVALMSADRGAWQNGMGFSVNAVTFERTLPSSIDDNWTAITASDGDSNNACLPPKETLVFGETTRNYAPKHVSAETGLFCIRDIMFDWQFEEMLVNHTRVLGEYAAWKWAVHYTSEYFRLAGHKLTLNSGNVITDSTSAYSTATPATGKLNQSVLDDIYLNLSREGGDEPFGWDMDGDAPVFAAIMSAETSRSIIRDNPDLRQDIRFAYEGKGDQSPLLNSLGHKRRSYGGFAHFIDPFPRRFILSGGAYVQIHPYVQVATTNGFAWNLNPAYKTAPYEETIIYHKRNYQSLVVNNVSNPAPGWKFDPISYMGDFTVRNILERTCNPDGTMIFWRAVFADASKPINPFMGYTILHARCGLPLAVSSCYTS